MGREAADLHVGSVLRGKIQKRNISQDTRNSAPAKQRNWSSARGREDVVKQVNESNQHRTMENKASAWRELRHSEVRCRASSSSCAEPVQLCRAWTVLEAAGDPAGVGSSGPCAART